MCRQHEYQAYMAVELNRVYPEQQFVHRSKTSHDRGRSDERMCPKFTSRLTLVNMNNYWKRMQFLQRTVNVETSQERFTHKRIRSKT